MGCYGDPDTPIDLATCNSLYDGCGTSGTASTIYTDTYPEGLTVKLWCPCFDVIAPEGCDGYDPDAKPDTGTDETDVETVGGDGDRAGATTTLGKGTVGVAAGVGLLLV